MPIDPVSLSELLQFLRKHDVAALATIKDGRARATTIYYYVGDDLRFYLLTRNGTEKFHELSINASVGLVVTDQETLQTVQIEGVAKEVDYAHEYAETMKKYMENMDANGRDWANLPINHQMDKGYYALVQITPTWIRWADFRNWAHTVKFEQKLS